MGRRPEQTFFQRGHSDGLQAHEKILNTVEDASMQIKITVRYHLTSVRMAIFKKNINNKCWQGCGEKETLIYR